jgi:hypothetical protein
MKCISLLLDTKKWQLFVTHCLQISFLPSVLNKPTHSLCFPVIMVLHRITGCSFHQPGFWYSGIFPSCACCFDISLCVIICKFLINNTKILWCYMFNIFWYLYYQQFFPSCFLWHNAYSLLLTHGITGCCYNTAWKLCNISSEALTVSCEGKSNLVVCESKLESNIGLVVNVVNIQSPSSPTALHKTLFLLLYKLVIL